MEYLLTQIGKGFTYFYEIFYEADESGRVALNAIPNIY